MLVDVGRQRNGAVLHQQRLQGGGIGTGGGELDHPAPRFLIAGHHTHRQGRLALGHHLQTIPGVEPLARPRQAEPLARGRARRRPGFEHQQLHRPPAGATCLEPRPQHPGVVHHQEITGPQLLLQIPHLPMAAARLRIHHQQPGRVARFHRPLGDALLGQGEVVAGELEVVGIEGSSRHCDSGPGAADQAGK